MSCFRICGHLDGTRSHVKKFRSPTQPCLLARLGVTVNVTCPGTFASERTFRERCVWGSMVDITDVVNGFLLPDASLEEVHGKAMGNAGGDFLVFRAKT